MKKLTIAAIIMVVGASIAFGYSLGVPWFADNADEGNDIPGFDLGYTSLVTLKNNMNYTMTCRILYFNQGGVALGPWAPNNTFTLAPFSSAAFRPVKTDPDTATAYPPWDSRAGTKPTKIGGQEGNQAVLVPNRPRSQNDSDPIKAADWTVENPKYVLNPFDGNKPLIDKKQNGGIQISWDGGHDKSIQGQYASFLTAVDQTKRNPYTSTPNLARDPVVTMSYGHLLPPGSSD